MAFAKTEYDVQQKILSILEDLAKKSVMFNNVSITRVVLNYEIEYGGHRRFADIAVLANGDRPLLIIETKKKYEREGSYRSVKRFHVASEEVLGQVFSYAAILKRKGVDVPFVATANDKQIAVFYVPEDIDNHVNWGAIRNREYNKVLEINYIYGVLREKYMLMHVPIRFTKEFFADILEKLTGIYVKRYKLEDIKQEPSWILIEDLRGFVDALTPFVTDAIAPGGRYGSEWEHRVNEYAQAKGYRPEPEQLAREMVYVLLNKIVFYKVLERHYKNLTRLEPLYSKGYVKTVNEYLKKLRELFEEAIKVTDDFEPVFRAGIYDEIECVEDEEVLKLLDWLVTLIEQYKIERLGDVIGYIYEELIPAEERHQLGQFYTPKPIAELIVKWCIRSPDDKVLDPGCGSGTFLVEAYKRLAELKLRRKFSEMRYVSREVHRQILSQLYGIDINEFPAHLTAMNLAMRNPKEPSSITNIVVEDYFNVTPGQRKLAPYRVRTVEGEKPAEIVFKDFDAIVGNPPYTRWGELSETVQRNILNSISDVLKKYDLYPTGHRRGSEYNMVVFWIIHSHGFLRENGRLGMIISNSWLQADYGVRFGKFLAEHFKIHAIIDFSPRVFSIPMVATCIILLEKSGDENSRDNNDVVFAYVYPGEEPIDVNKLLELVTSKREGEYPIAKTGKIIVRVIKQRELRLNTSKWLSYMLSSKEKELLERMTNVSILKKLGEFFEPVYGNTTYTILYTRGTVETRHAGVGGEDFFYLSSKDVERYGIPREYLHPLIPSPENITYFTFTRQDWENIKASGGKCFLFLCHRPRNRLPEAVQNYIKLGETVFVLSKGNRRGQPVSKSRAADERRRLRKYFYDWYDLGEVAEVPIYVTRGAQYWIRFALSSYSCALDDRILALIPRNNLKLCDIQMKALLAYLNSSFTQFQAEMVGRATGGGLLELDVKPLSKLLILDIKKLPKDVVEELAKFFDKLEEKARALGGAHAAENVFGSELATEITGKKAKEGIDGLFNTVIKEIDYRIGEILGFSKEDVDILRGLVVYMIKRRVARAGKAKPEALKGEETSVLRSPRGKAKQKSDTRDRGKHTTLDKFTTKK